MRFLHRDLEYKNRVVVGLIIIFALLFFCAGVGIYQEMLPVVTLKVNSVQIRQDEEIPQLLVQSEFSGNAKDVVLDEETQYTVADLLDDFNQGNGYLLEHDVDNTKEGNYSLELSLDENLKQKFVYSWNNKVKYHVENGTLKVLNKYGDWEGKKFRMLDGTYASGWTNLGEDTYYFDENGHRVTGEQQISGYTYYFLKDGKFDTEKNRINPNRPMIALTFDDGPGKYTDMILDKLEEYDSRASFFVLGSNVGKYPETIKRMEELGCEVGNHTYSHASLTKLTPEQIQAEVESTNQAISSVLGHGAALVRPTYGAVNEMVRTSVNYPLAMWSVDTTDWQSEDSATIVNYVLSTVQDGDVILLHDIHQITAEAMMTVIPELKEMGYQLVTFSEMAEGHNVTMENGVKYFNFKN